MALEAIEKEIEQKATEEAATLKRQAEAEAERLLEEAKSKARQMLEDAKKAADSEAASIRASGEANAEYEAKGRIAKARSAAIEREAELIKRRVARELESHMGEIIQAAVKSFAKVTELEGARIEVGKRYAEAAKASGMNVVISDIEGFTIRSADGRLTLRATPESMVERYASSIFGAVSEALPERAVMHGAHPRKRSTAKAKRNAVKNVKR
ncbi:MAG: hypothetical protein QXR29_02540 [Candidatus Micrarchaeaceae archaeon]